MGRFPKKAPHLKYVRSVPDIQLFDPYGLAVGGAARSYIPCEMPHI